MADGQEQAGAAGADFDVVIIGGGPGGYVAAIRAAQLVLKTACVELRDTLGGTCLNVGCVPSKALLRSSELYAAASKDFAAHGIEVTPKLNLTAMMARKDSVVDGLTKGIDFLFGKNKVTRIRGRGRIEKPGLVQIVEGPDSGKSLNARAIIIATGSEPTPLPGVPVDEKRIVTSTGALALKKVPERLVVIGGGVIGLELGSVWMRLGAQVTVVEYMDRVLPMMDSEISKNFLRILKKQGMKFKLGYKVATAVPGKNDVTLEIESAAGDGAKESLTADVVLSCVGRRPRTDGLGLEELGIARNARGFIEVDADFRTNIPGIYAIGDCAPGPMLAHKAEDEGIICAEKLAGMKPHLNYDLIPGVVYTHPEVAEVGASEEKLTAAGIAYKVGKFQFSANSRARANAETDGFVKVLADAATDRLLGAHIIGPAAGELIHELAAVMEFGGSAEDVARICHAHPTFSEAVREAAMDAGSGAIHA